MDTQHNRPLFAIGIVARIVGVHQHTLRNYEAWGLVQPLRSPKGTRYYSSQDLERIQRIREWIDVLGLNRAGVEVMLHMQKQILEYIQQIDLLQAEIKLLKQQLKARDNT